MLCPFNCHAANRLVKSIAVLVRLRKPGFVGNKNKRSKIYVFGRSEEGFTSGVFVFSKMELDIWKFQFLSECVNSLTGFYFFFFILKNDQCQYKIPA